MINETDEPEPQLPNATSTAVRWLLALNVGVYLLQVTLVSPERIFGTLGLDPQTFPAAWWTPVTYMFVHAGVWHLAINMAMLWMFGTRLEVAWTTRHFLYFYLWCGIGGALAHLLFARNTALVGASAGVSGILLAYGLRWPDERVYLFGLIPTRAKWLVAWMIAINIVIGLSPETFIGWKAHLGGLAFGWLFLQAGSLGGTSRVRRWVAAVPDGPDGMPRAIPRNRPTARERSHGLNEPTATENTIAVEDERPAPTGREMQRMRAMQLNRVLDKISKQGLGSLTRGERMLLDETSRELRDITGDK